VQSAFLSTIADCYRRLFRSDLTTAHGDEIKASEFTETISQHQSRDGLGDRVTALTIARGNPQSMSSSSAGEFVSNVGREPSAFIE
jgi:hypothetical protein